MRDYVRSHRVQATAIGLAVAAVSIFLFLWFTPQNLFINKTVNEAAPSLDPSATSSVAVGQTETIAAGSFRSLEHETKGRARLLKLADGTIILRLDAFSTSNGPDVRVYLSEVPSTGGQRAYGERFIDLGGLKGNKGSQNYEIPAATDVTKYVSVVIWCRRFTVGFGVAPLGAP